MRQYFDNYFKFDKEYSALDDAGRDAFVARYNLQSGGIAGSAQQRIGIEERLEK